MKNLPVSAGVRSILNLALIDIDQVVGPGIAVTIVLHDQRGRLFTLTDGPPGDLQIIVKVPGNDTP